MPAYDSNGFVPPAPCAIETLRSLAGVRAGNIPMLIDTGADVTLVPRAAIHQIGAAPDALSTYPVVRYAGQPVLLDSVILELIFLRGCFRGRYLITDESTGILGRDLLNHVILRLDGPGLQWDEVP